MWSLPNIGSVIINVQKKSVFTFMLRFHYRKYSRISVHFFKIDKHIPMWFQSFEIFQNKFVVVIMDTEKALVNEKVNIN